jgi:hypothetical protein
LTTEGGPVTEEITKEKAMLDGAHPRRDSGLSFVELLVAIVLTGTVVIAVLTGVRATIIASATNRDHANAHAWLQSATDVLYGEPRADCGEPGIPDAAAVLAAYEGVVDVAPNPEGWPASQITVASVQFWDGSGFGTDCFDDVAKTLQRIQIRVSDPDGTIVEDVEIVKGGDVAEID